MSRLGFLFHLFRRPPFNPDSRKATSTASLLAVAMATYTSTITRVPGTEVTPQDGDAKSHHVMKNGALVGFKNPHDSAGHGNLFSVIFKTVVIPRLTGELKSPDTTPPTVPVVEPEFLRSREGSDKLRATWLGHACYYVEFPSGLRVLFDPVFEDRCSPFSFLGPKRFTKKPCDLGDLPFVDAVLISHSHYDHLSHSSVLEIQKHHPNAQFFVGLGLAKWFRASGLKNVTELDWWQDAQLELRLDGGAASASSSPQDPDSKAPDAVAATISCTPCQHASARGLWDRDTTLWCSWAVRSGDKSVWFGGDTGYRAVPGHVPPNVDDYGEEWAALPRCPQFRQIGELRGPFDLGLIPIGAYAPRAAFSPVHANPFDAVEIMADTRCRRAMGIHWGTWVLTTEPVLEPPQLLREALRRKGLPETGVFDVCDIGESRDF